LTKAELIESSYILVTYPEVRDYMDEDWFANEAYPADNKGYFIPSRYLVSTYNKKSYMFPGPINL
tara:strand:- start:149 stop:343 length:195 start_codon:yes stop_codon:yes gene_type:complete